MESINFNLYNFFFKLAARFPFIKAYILIPGGSSIVYLEIILLYINYSENKGMAIL